MEQVQGAFLISSGAGTGKSAVLAAKVVFLFYLLRERTMKMDFNYEGHRKLWLLLAEHIQAAARKNYSGECYYNGLDALDNLKTELLNQYFSEPEKYPCNHCFACHSALLYKSENLEADDEICKYCPLRWPNGRCCDDPDSLYMKLICCIETNDTDHARELCLAIAAVEPYGEEEYEKKCL